jgi:hypothetical protein
MITSQRPEKDAGLMRRPPLGRLSAAMAAVALVLVAMALVGAGCGGDDDDEATTDTQGEAAAVQDEIANLSDEEQIERIGDAWVEPFAAGDEAMCAFLHPDLGAEASETCSFYAEGQLAQSAILQASFAGTTVKSVDVKGQTAVARFSHGEPVKFQQDADGAWWVLDPALGGKR